MIWGLCQIKIHHNACFHHRYMLSVSNIVKLLKQHNCKIIDILLTDNMREKKVPCHIREQKGKGFS